MTCIRIGNAIMCMNPWGRLKLGNRYVFSAQNTITVGADPTTSTKVYDGTAPTGANFTVDGYQWDGERTTLDLNIDWRLTARLGIRISARSAAKRRASSSSRCPARGQPTPCRGHSSTGSRRSCRSRRRTAPSSRCTIRRCRACSS